jgi:pilus assembly protein FimV
MTPRPTAHISPGSLFLFTSILCGAVWPAHALTLGAAEVRSFLGQRLDVRIAVAGDAGEYFDTACFRVAVQQGRDAAPREISAAEFKLDETLSGTTLRIRSFELAEDPNTRLRVRAACEGQPAIAKVYRLQLEPLPPVGMTLPTAPIARAPPNADTSETARAARSTQWQVRSGDTMENIAAGLFPASRELQSAYIAALRKANPGLGPTADSQALENDSAIQLPDLRVFGNENGRFVQPASPEVRAEVKAPPPAEKPRSAAELPKAAATTSTPPPASARAPAENRRTTRSETPGEGFRLRLSGVEMDLSPSRGITENMRAGLRGKQLILDADDQVAALLSLTNTVKQLETRVNELQLKLSRQTQALPAPSGIPSPPEKPSHAAPAVAPSPVAQATPPVPAAPAMPVVKPEISQPIQQPRQPPEPAPASKPVESKAIPVPTAVAASKSLPAETESVWTKPWTIVLAALAVVLLIFVLAYIWLGRRSSQRPDQVDEPALATPTRAKISDRATTSVAAKPAEEALSDMPQPEPAISTPASASGVQRADQQATARFARPPLDETPGSLELDTRPATEVDFPILVEERGEDRTRRQHYMEERYPEIANRTISVEEPDSIITAARLYFEEGHLRKAIELLTYAYEERRGQLRFWLALFELYRLERMVPEFAKLAEKFKNEHAGTDVWPKVQHIGRELDPSNPLFTAALGRLGLPAEREFDPVAENWLNAPMDFTSDVLMGELRSSLLDEYGVEPGELQAKGLAAAH